MVDRSETPAASGTKAAGPSINRVIFGRYMLPDMSEHACQVADITVDGAVFVAELVPPEGQPIVAYLEQLGRVEAITRGKAGKGFRVEFSLTGARRERLLARLNWLAGKQSESVSEERHHIRREVTGGGSQITLLDGRTYPCEVIDISLTGAAVAVAVLPAIGTALYLGKMRGRVVRYVERGFAMQFASELAGNQLSDVIIESPKGG